MLVLLLAGICWFFLAVGAVVFVFCGLLPPLRRFALSAALWCAVWGPCVSAWIMLAGLALVADGFAASQMKTQPVLTTFHRLAGWTYLGFAVTTSVAVGTVAAWLHQVVVRRLTFALFRIYATLVSAGVGSVWGWSLGFWMGASEVPYRLPLWAVGMVCLVGGFGYAGFRWARQLRGGAPERFTWVSREEFEGTG